MKGYLKVITTTTLLLLLATLTTGCGMAGLPFTGQITDAKTGKPIKGAIIVAMWRGEANPIADSTQTCYHVETAVSDERGNFRIPGWLGGKFGVMDSGVSVIAYKTGYLMPD